MRLRLVVCAALVLAVGVAGAAVSSGDASAAAKRCLGGSPMVVNAYGTYRNSADYAADGHVWALDAARESIQIWQVGTNTYCVQRQYLGTFNSFVFGAT